MLNILLQKINEKVLKRNWDTFYWEMVIESIWRVGIFLIVIYIAVSILTEGNTGDSRNQPEVTCEYNDVRGRVCY